MVKVSIWIMKKFDTANKAYDRIKYYSELGINITQKGLNKDCKRLSYQRIIKKVFSLYMSVSKVI